MQASEGDDLVSARIDRDPLEPAGNRKWLILGGAAAALMLVVLLIVFGTYRKPGAAAAPTQSASPATTSPVAAPLATAPAKTDNKAKPSAGTTMAASKKTPRTEAVATPAKPVDAGACDLTAAEIPRSLQRAENDMHAGRLDEAKAAFLGVRGCPGARERADEGLRQIQQAESLSTGR